MLETDLSLPLTLTTPKDTLLDVIAFESSRNAHWIAAEMESAKTTLEFVIVLLNQLVSTLLPVVFLLHLLQFLLHQHVKPTFPNSQESTVPPVLKTSRTLPALGAQLLEFNHGTKLLLLMELV